MELINNIAKGHGGAGAVRRRKQRPGAEAGQNVRYRREKQ